METELWRRVFERERERDREKYIKWKGKRKRYIGGKRKYREGGREEL
jgi:hypothetical protein